jgi:hypothetical protein
VKYAALVLKNLTRNRRRMILTVLSIAASLFIFSALAGMLTLANQILSDTASSVRIACHNKAGLGLFAARSLQTRRAPDALSAPRAAPRSSTRSPRRVRISRPS